MNNFIYYSELFNIYGFLLTDKQKEILELYFNENLSISEISENKKVSRSYVGKLLTTSKKKLDFYEFNLNHYELLQKLN